MIKDFLQAFSRATLFAKGDSMSINSTLFTIDVLIKHLQRESVSYPTLTFFFYLEIEANYHIIG